MSRTILADASCCHASVFEFVTFVNDCIEFLGRLFRLGSQEQASHGDFKAIVFGERVFGIKAMEKDHGSGYGHARQFENPTGFFNESTRLATLISLLLGRNAILDRRQLGDI
jgi:hypothetical protein